ncbi:alpha/beta hydrolase-fold protein [Vreelandella nanhaiensis]|uniref:Poly(3-hydroxybutyrate) depolymerase n=1 Tax=Vreelandella nanhaiensis TaxID=1258546 RepID=A0A433KPA0_9GAMM|nr:PHB depolymerase family esterase [Halomonas nanhaiensis]RUR31431.1 poly(3-hydroxybutyrate) depolymerase [Halomonas nanhaiensis]
MPAATRYAGVLLLVGGPLAANAAVQAPERLPALNAITQQASVVGVSSGGYMAVQLALAWPERFSGVGVLAAGPWGCSQGTLSMALNRCMMTRGGLPDLEDLEDRRARYLENGQVGDQEALGKLRAFIWHGGADNVVDPELVTLLAGQWRQWLAASDQLKVVHNQAAGHGWPVRLHEEETVGPYELGNCRQGGGSHVLACDEDVARKMLNWLYPERETVSPEPGELVAFDQSEFVAKGLADTGYLFIPASCEDEACPVTIALHGCQMSTSAIDDTFISHSGLNHWATRHRQIVLYPQIDSSLSNPQGCWDWWGYAESLWQQNPLHDTREGAQVSALMNMLDRLEEATQPN